MKTMFGAILCLLAVCAIAQQPSVSPKSGALSDGIEVKVQPGKPPGIGYSEARTPIQVTVRNNTNETLEFDNQQIVPEEGITIYLLDGKGNKTASHPAATGNASTVEKKIVSIPPGKEVSVQAGIPLRLLGHTYILSVAIKKIESGKSVAVDSAVFNPAPAVHGVTSLHGLLAQSASPQP